MSKIASCLMLLAFLAGCASVRPVATAPAPEPEPEPVTAPATAVEAPVNPGLENRQPVPDDARRRFEFSAQAIEQSSWVVAREELLQLVKDYPQLAGPSLSLALVYSHEGDARQAEHWFKQSISRNANKLQAYNQYGIFLREQGRFEQAEDVYLQALEVWEPHADTHRNIGILYDLYRGNKKAALVHFQRYQQLQDKEDRTVAGWIVDLERQLTHVAGRE